MKEENQKLKIGLKQAVTELEGVKNGAVDLAEVNSKAAVEKFKKSPELQEYLNSYRMGSLNMSYEAEYVEAKHPNLDRFFVDIV